MSNITVKVNYGAVGALLKSEYIQNVNEEIASGITAKCGEGYEYRSHNSGQRIITNIYPATKEAAHDNYKNDTLLRSLR